MSYEFESTVAGIPCIIHITSYSGGRPATHWEPCEYPEVEIEVCDRRGRPAPWLERKLDSKARADLETEALEHIASSRNDEDPT